MNALSLYLLVILGSSGGAWLIIRAWRERYGGGGIFPTLRLYGAVVVIASIGVVAYFLGWSPASGALPRSGRSLFRLEHSGFYAAHGQRLIFTHEGGAHSLSLSPLLPGESIAFWSTPGAPQVSTGNVGWNFASRAWGLPLRLNGRCFNLPSEQWLAPGDLLVFEDLKDKVFFSVRWNEERAGNEVSNAYFYDQGILDGTRQVSDFAAPIEVSQVVLTEGRWLSAMLRPKIPTIFKEMEAARTAAPPSILARFRNWFTQSDSSPQLRQGIDPADAKKRYRVLQPFFDEVLWVRRDLGDPRSSLGVLLEDALFSTTRWNVRRVTGTQERRISSSTGRRFETSIEPGTRVRYGLDPKDAAVLRLDGTTQQDPLLGLLYDVWLESAPSWRLPEDPAQEFLILSREVQVRTPGFVVDVGLDQEPFYAKTHYLPGREAFEVNDGKDFLGSVSADIDGPPAVQLEEPFRLGNLQQGVVLRFTRQPSPVKRPGVWAMVALLLAGLAYWWVLQRENLARYHLDLAWALVWGLTITILVVRLVLAHRLAMVPPLDASADDLRNVFGKSLWLALVALFVGPLVVVGARWIASLEGEGWIATTSGRRSSGPPFMFIMLGIAFTAWLIAGSSFGGGHKLLGLRVNIIAHILIIAGLIAAANWISQCQPKHRLAFLLGWLLLPAFLVVLFADTGFIVHYLSLALTGCLLLAWDRQVLSRRSLIWIGVAVIIGVVGVVAWPHLMKTSWMERRLTKVFNPADSTTYYRLMAQEPREDVLTRQADENAYNPTLLLQNSKQHWQMLLYASEGLTAPRGYGGVPLSRYGMNYPTSATDCVYSIYILAEHGWLVGILLLLVYIALGGALICGGAFLTTDLRSRALGLTAIGAYFAFTALYMASANLGLLPFTGQNLPLLSLLSGSDLLAGLALLVVATWLLRHRVQTDEDFPFSGQPWARYCLYAAGFVVVAWLALDLWQMSHLRDERHRRPFSFPESAFARYERNLPESGDGAQPLQLNGEEIVVVAPSSLTWLEKHFVRMFEFQSDRYDPLAGFYYLEDTGTDPQLRINRNYFSQDSPFTPASRWQGAIALQGPELPTLDLLGSDVSLRPGRKTPGESRSLCNSIEPTVELSDRLVLTCGTGPYAPSICELSADEEGFWIDPYDSEALGTSWRVYVNGERLRERRKLSGGEIIRITGDEGGRTRPSRAFSLFYTGQRQPALAFSSWRNGRVKRVTADGSLAKLGDDLGRLLDARQADVSLPEQVSLTVVDSLHRQLDKILEEKALAIYGVTSPADRRRRASLVALDAHTGDILALPSWPSWKLPPEAEARGLQKESLQNDNLRNHVIGSTIKPLLFAAVASGYWPAGFDLGELVVEHRGVCAAGDQRLQDLRKEGGEIVHPHCNVAGVELTKPWDCRQNAVGEIHQAEFIKESRNFYGGVTGMLGMVLEPNDWTLILGPATGFSAETRVRYRGESLSADLRRTPPERTAFTFADAGPPRPKKTELGKTLLMANLPKLFSVELDLKEFDGDIRRSNRRHRFEKFFPGLATFGLDEVQGSTAVLPDLVNVRPGSFHWVRADLISFLIGGGTQRWNNILLAESAARLVTGREVVARLGVDPSQTGPKELPLPLSNPAWRRQHIIDPMSLVGTTAGTASDLADLTQQVERDGYRVLFKTGTLEEIDRSSGRRFESELLLFVIGEWNNEEFVRGKTIAGLLYLEDSRVVGEPSKRARVARPLLQELFLYLKVLESDVQER